MKINHAGKKLIKDAEGLRLEAYLCPAQRWTLGYGHVGADVLPGLTITEAEAEVLLETDLVLFEKGVAAAVTVPLTRNQFSALVSFAYNLGLGRLIGSTLLRKLNAGDYDGAALEFLRWDKAGGKVLPGLTRRRAAEAALFMHDDGVA